MVFEVMESWMSVTMHINNADMGLISSEISDIYI